MLYSRCLFVSIVFLLLFSCKTHEYNYIGSTGSRYGINPFPSNSEWEKIILDIQNRTSNKTNKSILWPVTSYNNGVVNCSFPNNELEDNYSFAKFDFNEEYFNYFDKNKIDVILLIEPGLPSVDNSIEIVLNHYSHHKSVVGICIDFEWSVNEYNKGNKRNIEKWLFQLSDVNKNYLLVLKHWDLTELEYYLDDNLLYLQSLEGINNRKEMKYRFSNWYRKFYPNFVGVEVGLKKDHKIWEGLTNPLEYIYKDLVTIPYKQFSFFWNEETIMDILEY